MIAYVVLRRFLVVLPWPHVTVSLGSCLTQPNIFSLDIE